MRASLPATVTGALAVARDSCTLSARHSAPPRKPDCKFLLNRGNGFVRICECGKWNG
jgi:hypothetical protein